jgi:DNA-binding IclR family transcriptional regulator
MAVVPAAQQALRVLRFLSTQAGPVPAASIIRELRLPRSTTYHLLDTLVHEGFVVHVPEEQRYGIGMAAYELGTGYSRQAPLQRLARVPLAHLVDRCGHSGHLAVQHGRDVVYVIEERARGRARLVSDVGVRLPAALTASGRAMLAGLTQAQIRALYPDRAAFVLRTSNGPASLSALRTLLVDTRKRGYAEENGEITHGLASIGVAVLDHNRQPAASVAVTFPSEAANIEQRAKLSRLIAHTAREIGIRLGARET